ncbi:MAG: flavin reductase family protein [Bacteroidota bacterium]
MRATHSPASPPAPIDLGDADLGDALRHAMRHVASPVTVVTAASGPTATEAVVRGATIGSFTSVSLDPPLVSFNVIRGTGLHGVLETAEAFCVHLLHAGQAHLATHFAVPDLTSAEQLATIPHRLNDAGVPVLDGAMGVFHCRAWARHRAGDHDLILGEVTRVEGGSGAEPLLYYARSYRTVGEVPLD